MSKKRYTWAVWGQKQVHFKTKSRAHPTSPAQGPKRIVPVFGPIKPRYTRVCLLSTVFLSFLSQRPSIVPPYAPHTNADGRGDPLHPTHPTPRLTSKTSICLYTSAEIHLGRYDIRIPTCTMATDGSASAASEIEVGSIDPTTQTRYVGSIYPTMQGLGTAAAKQADRQIRV